MYIFDDLNVMLFFIDDLLNIFLLTSPQNSKFKYCPKIFAVDSYPK